MPFCISWQGFQMNARITTAELQKGMCKCRSLLEIAHNWCVLLPQCNAENVKLWNPTVARVFCWQCMESACGLWIASLDWTCAMFSLLNLRTYVYLTGAMDYQSIALCHITASHPFIVLTVHMCLRPPIYLLTGWFLSVCVCNVRWAWGDLCQVKNLLSFY